MLYLKLTSMQLKFSSLILSIKIMVLNTVALTFVDKIQIFSSL